MDTLVVDMKNVIYKAVNIFSHERYIYFFVDAPHVFKKGNNCLYHSGSGRGTRHTCSNQIYIIWNHVANIFYDEVENELKVDAKLSYQRIELTLSDYPHKHIVQHKLVS